MAEAPPTSGAGKAAQQFVIVPPGPIHKQKKMMLAKFMHVRGSAGLRTCHAWHAAAAEQRKSSSSAGEQRQQRRQRQQQPQKQLQKQKDALCALKQQPCQCVRLQCCE